jgi:hypothetical protein
VASQWWHNPLADADEKARREASRAILDPDTPARRRAQLVEEYGVDWIVISRDDDLPGVQRALDDLDATEVHRVGDVVVYRVGSAVGA